MKPIFQKRVLKSIEKYKMLKLEDLNQVHGVYYANEEDRK